MVLEDERQNPQFAVGSEVEVSSDDEGYRGIWFPAKIISIPSKANNNRYFVEYKNFVSEENGSDPLTEHVEPSFVRPPLPKEEGCCLLEVKDVVEAYHLDGWWIGVVTEVLGEGRCRVFFQNPPDEMEFERGSLRFHKDWVDGKWVRPDKKTTGELIFSPGATVEVNLEHGLPEVWYPGTVVKEIATSYFMVEYMNSDNTELLIVVVDHLHIRPSPPRCNNTTFQLLDKVDAFCNFGWSSGVITKILGDGRYIVFFKRTKKEKELRHNDLRIPMAQINGKWVHSSQDVAVVSNPQEYSVTNLTDNGKISFPPENSSATNGSAEELRNGQDEQRLPSETAYVRNVSPLRIELPTLNNCSYEKSCGKLNEEALPGAQFRPQVVGTKATLLEELNAQLPAILANSDMEDNAPMGKSSRRKKLKAEDDMITFGTNKKNSWSKQEEIAHRITLALGAESRTPKLSAADKLEKKKALGHAIDDGIRVSTTNEGGHEQEDLMDEGTSPKRKRGTPYGSLIVHGSANLDKPKETHYISDGDWTLRRSTRERKTVYGSLKLIRKPVKKKMRMTTDILSSSREFEDSRKQKAEALLKNRISLYPEPVSNEDSGNISDDRPLSSQLGDSHSPSIVDGTQSEGKNQVSNETLEHNAIMSTRGKDTGQGDSEEIIHPLPFTKTSPIWKTIDEMEVFRQIPQNPHFQPLYEAKENRREGLAIGCMVTYSSLVEKISNFHFTDPKKFLYDGMETLQDLETQGFNVWPVWSWLDDLLSIKGRHESSQTISEVVTSQIEEGQRQRAGIEGDIDEIDEKIAELTEKRAMAVSKIEMKECELKNLQLERDVIMKDCEAARAEFEKLVTAPWRARKD